MEFRIRMVLNKMEIRITSISIRLLIKGIQDSEFLYGIFMCARLTLNYFVLCIVEKNSGQQLLYSKAPGGWRIQ